MQRPISRNSAGLVRSQPHQLSGKGGVLIQRLENRSTMERFCDICLFECLYGRHHTAARFRTFRFCEVIVPCHSPSLSETHRVPADRPTIMNTTYYAEFNSHGPLNVSPFSQCPKSDELPYHLGPGGNTSARVSDHILTEADVLEMNFTVDGVFLEHPAWIDFEYSST